MKLTRIAQLEKHLGITIDELLEKLDETGGDLAIIKKLNKEDGEVIWQGGQE